MTIILHFKKPDDIKKAMSVLSNINDGGYTQTSNLTLKITHKQLHILKDKGIID